MEDIARRFRHFHVCATFFRVTWFLYKEFHLVEADQDAFFLINSDVMRESTITKLMTVMKRPGYTMNASFCRKHMQKVYLILSSNTLICAAVCEYLMTHLELPFTYATKFFEIMTNRPWSTVMIGNPICEKDVVVGDGGVSSGVNNKITAATPKQGLRGHYLDFMLSTLTPNKNFQVLPSRAMWMYGPDCKSECRKGKIHDHFLECKKVCLIKKNEDGRKHECYTSSCKPNCAIIDNLHHVDCTTGLFINFGYFLDLSVDKILLIPILVKHFYYKVSSHPELGDSNHCVLFKVNITEGWVTVLDPKPGEKYDCLNLRLSKQVQSALEVIFSKDFVITKTPYYTHPPFMNIYGDCIYTVCEWIKMFLAQGGKPVEWSYRYCVDYELDSEEGYAFACMFTLAKLTRIRTWVKSTLLRLDSRRVIWAVQRLVKTQAEGYVDLIKK